MADIQKGVMLCERPANNHMAAGGDGPAFKPASAPQSLDPLGLVPVRKEHEIRPSGPSVTDLHRKWIKQYTEEIRDAKAKQQAAETNQRNKREELANFTAKLRSTILKGESVSDFWEPASTTSTLGGLREPLGSTHTPHPPQPKKDAALMKDVDDFVNSLFDEEPTTAPASAPEPGFTAAAQQQAAAPESQSSGTAASSSQPASARPASAAASEKAKSKKKKNKPAWALTEEDVDALEDEEAMELLNFADGLDFDSFVAQLDDPDLQQTFKTLDEADPANVNMEGAEDKEWRKNMVKAMNHVAMKKISAAKLRFAGDDDAGTEGGASEAPSCASRTTAATRSKAEAAQAKLSNLAAQSASRAGGFDASSIAAADVARMEKLANKAREAEDLLRENPEMKSVHSTASVRAMLLKTEEGQ